MSLSEIEVRVLGALVEKERTTPESYPLSTNTLVLACNQKSNREPVTGYGQLEVEETLRALQTKGLVESAQSSNERVVKHRHCLTEALDIGGREMAVLAVLMLRGPQTPGELRGRTERYVHFADVAAVEASLTRLLEHQPSLVKNHGRGPGQSQNRWGHTLGPDPEKGRPRARQAEPPESPEEHAGLEDLQREVARLRRQVERLLEHTGLPESDEGF